MAVDALNNRLWIDDEGVLSPSWRMIGACSSAGRRTGSDMAQSAECRETGTGRLARDRANPLEQPWLPGLVSNGARRIWSLSRRLPGEVNFAARAVGAVTTGYPPGDSIDGVALLRMVVPTRAWGSNPFAKLWPSVRYQAKEGRSVWGPAGYRPTSGPFRTFYGRLRLGVALLLIGGGVGNRPVVIGSTRGGRTNISGTSDQGSSMAAGDVPISSVVGVAAKLQICNSRISD